MRAYLNDLGKQIYDRLEKHCKTLGMAEIDNIELTALAASYALYFENLQFCNENGIKFTMTTEKGGEYEQIRPEYTVMCKEAQWFSKHSAKFGMTPGDRQKIFKDFGKEKEADPLEGLNAGRK